MPDNAAPLILLTRPAAQAERFAKQCRAEFGDRVEILVTPMQEIVLLDLPAVPPGAGLIFTSENGVRAYQAGGGKAGLTAYCVGDRTARVAAEAGLNAQSAGGAAGELVALIRGAAPDGPLIHLHGTHVRGGIAKQLCAAGFDVTGHVVYDQRSLPLDNSALKALSGTQRVIVPLFSPRSATLFAADLPAASSPDLICISDATRAALPAALRQAAILADEPTGAAMLKALARQLSP
ncbi:uroporphyrinogen-III synthase [Nioella aestuarii]|uniref:uroporphyrinogen-III synthase n=1 Tax=Nioella aestuarii TaxID=1662864 RepID=UPI003D7F3D5C